MSVRHASLDLDLIFMVYWLLNLRIVFVIRVCFSITIQTSLTIFGPHIDWGGYMSAGHVSSDFDLIFHGLQTLLNLRKVFVIMSVSPLPYKLDSLYLVHRLIMDFKTWGLGMGEIIKLNFLCPVIFLDTVNSCFDKDFNPFHAGYLASIKTFLTIDFYIIFKLSRTCALLFILTLSFVNIIWKKKVKSCLSNEIIMILQMLNTKILFLYRV
jgi:hypothetical protein